VDTLFQKPENGIRKMAIGARKRLRIDHLFERKTLQIWFYMTYSGPPVHANNPGVFDRTGGHFHINGAHIGEIQKSKPAKCPD
jgi:hypothetical protein